MRGEDAPNQPEVGRVRPSAAERDLLNQGIAEGEDRAAAEARQIGSGLSVRDLKKEAEESDHERSEKFRDAFEDAIIWMMRFAVAGFLALAAVWAVNLCLPTDGRWPSRWLSPEEMHNLQSILTGGLLIGLVGDHVRRRMALNHPGGA